MLTGAQSDAAVIVVGEASVFEALVVDMGGSVLTEGFAGYSGFYASGVGGGSGASAWTAASPGNLYATAGIFSTDADRQPLTFSFASADVFAVGGRFFNTNFFFDIAPGLVQVTAGGATYMLSSSATGFAGFVSTSGAIQSITIAPFGSAGVSLWASTDGIVVGAVPAPGGIALLGLAGFARRRRR